MSVIASTYTTTYLLTLYPDLPMPGTPWTCKDCWHKWYQDWMREPIPEGRYVATVTHKKLLRVREVLLNHHAELNPTDGEIRRSHVS